MSKLESRRIVFASYVAVVAVGVLVIGEVVMLSGLLELQPATVARVAPWAYEPFLKLIGEHPTSRAHRGADPQLTPAVMTVEGFDPGTLSTPLDPEFVPLTNSLIEPFYPVESRLDESAPDEDDVPVG